MRSGVLIGQVVCPFLSKKFGRCDIVRGVREKSFFDQKIRNDVLGRVGGARGRGNVWRAIGVNRGALGGIPSILVMHIKVFHRTRSVVSHSTLIC